MTKTGFIFENKTKF